MRRFLLSVFLCTFASVGSGQQGGSATLLIQADADCTVTIDGAQPTEVLTDAVVRLSIGPGDHIIAAVSKEWTGAKWRAVVATATGQQKAVLIALAATIKGGLTEVDEDGIIRLRCGTGLEGNCAENEYQEMSYSIYHSNPKKREKLSSHYSFDKALGATPRGAKVFKNQTSLAKWAHFKMKVLDAMSAEADVPDKLFVKRNSLFTPQSVAETYLRASENDSDFNKIGIFLGWYSQLVREKIKQKQAIDVSRVWHDAIYSAFNKPGDTSPQQIEEYVQEATRGLGHYFLDE